MIELFVIDLDGCISSPFLTPDWGAVTNIRELNRQSREQEHIPALSICTGRPFPYAEAVAQWLDVRVPFVFECAGIYDFGSNRILTGLDGTEKEGLQLIHEVKSWIQSDLLPEFPDCMVEFSKMMDAGIISSRPEAIDPAYEKIMEVVDERFPGVEVHRTSISVNILIRGNNKKRGLELISGQTGIKGSRMAYIGDSEGDIAALESVARPFAPANAIDRVKAVAEVVPFETTHAVLDAYERLIRSNRESS